MLFLTELITALDDFAWGWWTMALLLGTGVFLSARTGFVQFRRFGYAMRNTLGRAFRRGEAGKGEITPFQAMTTALAGTVGTGNITGVTSAIFVGGPGAVFWLWLSALFGMATKYAEVTLAVRYRERDAKGDWVGGSMYYITRGLGQNWDWLAGVFCVFGCIAAFGIGNTTQVDSIATSVGIAIDAFGGDFQGAAFGRVAVGAAVAVFVALVLFGGIKRIGSVTEKLVPFMALLYMAAALAVILGNPGQLGRVFGLIFSGAFRPKAALGGAVGVTLTQTIRQGFARGIFSNEAGLGSAPMAHAATSERDPVNQGLYGILEVFMDSVVICTLTALALLCGLFGQGVEPGWGSAAGSEMVVRAFSSVFGTRFSALIVAAGLSFFALSTILSWALYGTRCFQFLFGVKAVRGYQIVFLAVLVAGSTLGLDLAWKLGDALNGLMAIPNLVGLLALSGVVVKLTRDHFS